MMQGRTRTAARQQTGRTWGGLCRGPGSGDRPAAPAGPRDLSHPPDRSFSWTTEPWHALKDELLYSQPQVVDDAGRGLVWTGDAVTPPSPLPPSSQPAPQPAMPEAALPQPAPSCVPSTPRRNAASSPCCSVTWWTPRPSPVSSTRKTCARWCGPIKTRCAKVIARFEGHIAQYLGDGLLVYFGYPLAHEDDAQRAVRAGLGILEALGQLNTRLAQERGVHLAVRLGIHTGLVVVGEVGGGTAAGTVGARRDPQPGGPPARARGAQYPGDQCHHLSAPRRLLCLPAVRDPAPERPGPAAGGLSRAL